MKIQVQRRALHMCIILLPSGGTLDRNSFVLMHEKRRDCCCQRVCIPALPLHGSYAFFSSYSSWIVPESLVCHLYFPLSVMAILATLVMHTYGLESGQLQAWQAFYDAVGVSGCSKCNSRTNPCGCSSSYIECTSDDQYLTKIGLSSCSLSGKSFFCIIAFFIWFSHGAIFFLIVQYCQNDFLSIFVLICWMTGPIFHFCNFLKVRNFG